MANDLTPIRFLNFDGLLNAGVSDFLMLNNECIALKNCWSPKIGRLEKTPGYSKCTLPISSLSRSISSSTSPSPSISSSLSPSRSISISPSVSLPNSASPSASPSRSPSRSPSVSPSVSPSASPSRSPSISVSISTSVSPSVSLSKSPSASPSISASASPPNSVSPSVSISISPSASVSISTSLSPSMSISLSPSASPSVSKSVSPSVSPSIGGDIVVSAEDVIYLHYYYDTETKNKFLISVSNDGSNLTLYYRTTGQWYVVSGIGTTFDGYSGSTIDMENYLGRAFIVGYQSSDTFLPNAIIKNGAFSASDSNLTSMPQGKFIVRYKDLLYVLHAKTDGEIYPTRAYYCDEPTNNAIGWTNLTTAFVEFGYDDGDEITGGAECLNRLIVFKTNSMWKYDESNAEEIADIGCNSNRSIQKINKILYWFNRDGFWRWRGNQPELISAKAQPYIDAIDQNELSNVVATVFNSFEYRAYIGTVTVDNIIYTNAWFCWDTRKEKCYIRCTYNSVKSACVHVENDKKRAYFGSTDGYVYKFANIIDGVYTDNDNEIDSFFITKNLDYGAPEVKKIVNNMTVFTKHAAGMKVAVDVDNRGEYRESNIRIIKQNIDNINFLASGNRYRYKFYQKGGGKSWEFEGFTILTKSIET